MALVHLRTPYGELGMALLPSFTVQEEDAYASQVSCYAKEHHEDNVRYSEASHEDRWSLKRD